MSLPANDQGTTQNGQVNLVTANKNSLVVTRMSEQVLATVFDGGITLGALFPNGVAGLFTSPVS